jgi:hypothetical protein
MGDFRGECVFCDGEVRGQCARELSSAWEVERAQGGANMITGPKEHSGRVAHTYCLDAANLRIRAGVAPTQDSML